jgi:hypothetical protein
MTIRRQLKGHFKTKQIVVRGSGLQNVTRVCA